MRLTIVGAGRIGLSLAADLAGASPFAPIAVAGRAPAPPPFLRDAPDVGWLELAAGPEPSLASGSEASLAAVATPGRGPAARHAGLQASRGAALVFAVPDDALAAAAATWATAWREAGIDPPAVALHTSGFHPAATALAPLAEAGAAVGGWHPLVALARPRRGAFHGRTVGLEGADRALALGEAMAAAVGARAVRVAPGAKGRWHAAAVLASNALFACLSVAVRELEAASEGGAGLGDLLPLARSALEEAAASGLSEGLTGPVARGDAETVAGHLAALDPAAAALYRPLAAELLRLAAPRLDAEALRALRAALAGTAGEQGPERGIGVEEPR